MESINVVIDDEEIGSPSKGKITLSFPKELPTSSADMVKPSSSTQKNLSFLQQLLLHQILQKPCLLRILPMHLKIRLNLLILLKVHGSSSIILLGS
jgi:hypothetical protein